MRDGLHRAKTLSNNMWVYGGLLHQTDFYGLSVDDYYIIDGTRTLDYDIGFPYKVDPETVGVFTGGYDKNKVKVFEHDIIKWGSAYLIISYDEQGFRFRLKLPNDTKYYPITATALSHFEVVGNIFDNPELLMGVLETNEDKI